MKAWICPRYGAPDVLRLVERPDPEPGRGEIVVRVEATTVSTADARVRAARFPTGMAVPARLALGWSGPRQPVLGTDAAGVVAAVGPEVSRWRVGDRVLVVRGAAMGCHAELVRAKADGVVVPIPDGVGAAEAVSLPFGGQTARWFLSKAGLAAGHEVLVFGAAGAVGVAALQEIARASARAVAVARGTNAEWVRSFGAAETIDHETTDCASGARRYDLVLDCVGAGTFRSLRHLAKRGGAYLAVAGGLPEFLARPRDGVRCVTGVVSESAAVVGDLLARLAAGTLKPMIGERVAFADLPSGHALVDRGRKRGTLVVDAG